jgi:hypothetical protein
MQVGEDAMLREVLEDEEEAWERAGRERGRERLIGQDITRVWVWVHP